MTNTSRCLNCKEITEFYIIYARIPIPKTKKNKWVRLDEFRICSKCNAITIKNTMTYKDVIRVNDGSFKQLDKLVIVPKSENELTEDEKLRDSLRKTYNIS